MNGVLLGLGSNASYNGSSSLELLGHACTQLSAIVDNLVCSSVYRTKAMYVADQSDFYNMAVRGTVHAVTPEQLLCSIHDIEAILGRDRSREVRFGPRSIDIDIELFENRIIDEPDLQIPHQRFHERKFILVPALEILTEPADCIEREKCTAYMQTLPDQGIKLYLSSSDFRKSFFPEAVHGRE